MHLSSHQPTARLIYLIRGGCNSTSPVFPLAAECTVCLAQSACRLATARRSYVAA